MNPTAFLLAEEGTVSFEFHELIRPVTGYGFPYQGFTLGEEATQQIIQNILELRPLPVGAAAARPLAKGDGRAFPFLRTLI